MLIATNAFLQPNNGIILSILLITFLIIKDILSVDIKYKKKFVRLLNSINFIYLPLLFCFGLLILNKIIILLEFNLNNFFNSIFINFINIFLLIEFIYIFSLILFLYFLFILYNNLIEYIY